jgi:ribonuclease R
MAGRISGVTRFGLFVTLLDSGADGLVPISTLGGEYWDHDESQHALVGRQSGETYRLGQRLMVRLLEAEIATGGLILGIPEDAPTEFKGVSPGSRWGRSTTKPEGRAGRPLRPPQTSKGKAVKTQSSSAPNKSKRQTRLRPKRPTGKPGRGRGKR